MMKKYKTILADPPWKYGKGWGWGAGKYYKLMRTEDICRIPVSEIADDNCHLYLWSPNGMIPQALEVMKNWGFSYKTMITWVKNRSIFGYYFKGQTEQLLFGVRGKLPPFDRKQTTLLNGVIEEHSKKPQEQYSIIEKVSPNPYVELFARDKRRGWDSIGFDIDGHDITESIKNMNRL